MLNGNENKKTYKLVWKEILEKVTEQNLNDLRAIGKNLQKEQFKKTDHDVMLDFLETAYKY